MVAPQVHLHVCLARHRAVNHILMHKMVNQYAMIIEVRQCMLRAVCVAGCLMMLFAVACPAVARARDAGAAPAQFVEITPQSRRAVKRGLMKLATLQDTDGGFTTSRFGKHAGITALACLAFMADGHVPGRGTHGEAVRRGLEFTLRHCQETGLIAAGTSHGPMYGHGFATLFLGEVYGMTGNERVREPLVKATRMIVNTQNPQGGWRYHPVPFDADLSVTICQIMAMRSARNAGIAVPRETVERAIGYVRACHNRSDGGFRYQVKSKGSAFPRSAAGVASLYYAGIYEDKLLTRGLDYLVAERNRQRAAKRQAPHYYYGHYYAVQAMFLAGGDYWSRWYPDVRDELLASQQDGGTWQSGHGPAYGTAMALIILQVPNRYLPIFQR